MKRAVLQWFLHSVALADFAVHDDQLRHLALLVPDSGRDRLRDPLGAVVVLDAVIQLSSASRAARPAGRLEHLKAIIGMDLLKRLGFPEFCCGIA
jgi:hypothetical protein